MTAPFIPGDWVANHEDDHSPIFGRVKECMKDPDGWFINLIVYAPHGERIGRRSPACSGPTSFEPFIAASRFRRIKEPVFPIKVDKWSRGYKVEFV